MKRLSIIIALLVVSLGLSLAFAATTKLGEQARNNYQQNRQLPPPMPPRNSNVGREPPPRPSPTPCPGLRECTAAENDTPTQLHVEFPGPDGMTLHGHLYVPGVKTSASCPSFTTTRPLIMLQSTPRGAQNKMAAIGSCSAPAYSTRFKFIAIKSAEEPGASWPMSSRPSTAAPPRVANHKAS